MIKICKKINEELVHKIWGRTNGQVYSSIPHTLRVGYKKVCTNQTKIKKKFLFWEKPFMKLALYVENWVHILCTQLVIYLWRILFIFGMMDGHDVSMRILYRFHDWLSELWRTDKCIPVYPTLCEWGIKKFVQIRLK
jgi:hypothetical protein